MKNIHSAFNIYIVRHIFSSFICLSLTSSAWAGYYSITDLGTLGGTFSIASGINNNGQVVGVAATAGNSAYHAFLYSTGGMIDLGTLGGYESSANAINNNGQVVGRSLTASGDYHAFVYNNGNMTDLGTPGYDSAALGINNKNQIVGYANTDDSSYAFLYSNGSMTDLGSGSASGINDNGQVATSMQKRTGVYHATLNSSVGSIDLGTLGGPDSYASAINNNGQVVGYSTKARNSLDQHAFLYSNGSMVDLDFFGSTNSQANAINNRGQVVGSAFKVGYGSHAFLFSNEGVTDLNDLLYPNSGWILDSAQGINDLGQMVGSGSINGEMHAFLLSESDVPQVPIPATVWLFSSGLFGLFYIGRKRKRT